MGEVGQEYAVSPKIKIQIQEISNLYEHLNKFFQIIKRDNNDFYLEIDNLIDVLFHDIDSILNKLFYLNAYIKDEDIDFLMSVDDFLDVLKGTIIHSKINEKDEVKQNLSILQDACDEIRHIIDNQLKVIVLERNSAKSEKIINELEQKNKILENMISKNNLISNDLKNKKVHEIFEGDSENFKKLALNYERAFYIIVALMILYFLGLTFYVGDLKLSFIEVGFPEKIHGNLSAEFYIQKISLLVLSTTLAAFLLKRSFMNRRLADDAYRTAKELDALPRYMEGMPDEMKEKIRFDLAYKYFGNGIHHESYTGGENLMHENIKANTDFIKAVKDLTPKADKAPKDAA